MADTEMNSKDKVERMLKGYQQNLRTMAANAEAIALYVPVTEEEVIEMMIFGKASGDVVQNTNVSQKVASISERYKRTARSWNREALKTLMKEYQAAWTEVAFIDYAIKRLAPRERAVMSRFVYEDASWTDVCESLHISNAMVGRSRRDALERICQIYEVAFTNFELLPD